MGKGRNINSLKFKLTAGSLSMLVVFAAIICILSLNQANKQLNKVALADAEKLLDSAVSLIDLLNSEAVEGRLTIEEAQNKARDILNGPILQDNQRDLTKVAMRFGKDGYFFGMDSEGMTRMHPYLEGKNMMGVKSKDGKIDIGGEITSTKQGTHRVNYLWSNNEKEPLKEKIMLSKYYAPWDWFIGVSIYQDDLKVNINEMLPGFIMLILIVLLIGGVLAYIASMRIAGVISKAVETVEAFAGGDLNASLKMKGKDEFAVLAENINKISTKLGHIIGQVINTAKEIGEHAEMLGESSKENNRAIEQVGEAMGNLANGASEQAMSAQKGAEMTKVLNEEIQIISRNAEEMAGMITELHGTKESGMLAVSILREKSTESSTAAAEIEEGIMDLNGKSSEIGHVVDVITEITSRTNLLALNAAIEAARAGEHGRGFGVVAGEIKKLSEQTQESTKVINKLLTDIRNSIQANASIMNETRLIVKEQMEAVEETDHALCSIASVCDRFIGHIEDVGASIGNMQTNSGNMVDVISDISAIAEESAAATQEIYASTEEQMASFSEISSSIEAMAEMAGELVDIAKHFKLKS